MRPLPFPPVWIGTDLGEFRTCDSTYCRYDYRSLPRLPSYLFDGTFSWLRKHPSPLEYDERFAKCWGKGVIANWKAEARQVQSEFSIAAREFAVPIPDAFMSFLFDADLVTMIRSPTDCYFRFPTDLIVNRGESGGHFVHFFSDSQNCYEWYLFVDPAGQHCVVASIENLSEEELPERFWDNDRQETVYCAPSFEAFVFRLWIESEICIRLFEKDQPLTDEMQQYLNSSRNSKEVEY